ncbi:MAG: ribbon-helix-helix domain-containing protein [Candidatus Puniceispirillaceae bacterium]
MTQGRDSQPRQRRRGGAPRPNPASTGRRLKRNVRLGGRRTTIVLEAYYWESIDNMLVDEAVSLDEFCAHIDNLRQHSSMASSARIVVLIYFRLREKISGPPFVDPDLQARRMDGSFHAPHQAGPPAQLLPLVLRRFAQDEAHAG